MVEIVENYARVGPFPWYNCGNALMVFDIRPPLVKIVEMVDITS